ncbi:hypothetical protein EYF80_049417 [Liparis tanakae]|uniref:Uncharacterized protein n=1 Tax=Liparis tanakae TaxID=230148 RepID=A0A4Z2FI16_9TELE|nr:hypothetical protein EYF80_049417 [Liparis tanakae]
MVTAKASNKLHVDHFEVSLVKSNSSADKMEAQGLGGVGLRQRHADVAERIRDALHRPDDTWRRRRRTGRSRREEPPGGVATGRHVHSVCIGNTDLEDEQDEEQQQDDLNADDEQLREEDKGERGQTHGQEEGDTGGGGGGGGGEEEE